MKGTHLVPFPFRVCFTFGGRCFFFGLYRKDTIKAALL